jgi:hypothetical protein
MQSEVGVQTRRPSNFLLGGRRGEDDFTENVITLSLLRSLLFRDWLALHRCGIIYAFRRSGVSTRRSRSVSSARARPTTSRYSLAQRQAVPLHSLLFDVCVSALAIDFSAAHTCRLWKCIWCRRGASAAMAIVARCASRRCKIIRA